MLIILLIAVPFLGGVLSLLSPASMAKYTALFFSSITLVLACIAYSLFTTQTNAPMLAFDEVFQFIEVKKLFAKGVSFVDVMLIMSALTVGARIWSLDKNLVHLANHLQLATLKL